MRIVINHLTRMQRGYCCVAGIDERTGLHVRPMLPRGSLTIAHLAPHGGVFDMARVVDLGPTRPRGQAPEVEDHEFHASRATHVGDVDPESFWKLLAGAAQPCLRSLFGPDLQKRMRFACGVDQGKGTRSLACLVPVARPALSIDQWNKIRISVSDGEFDLRLSVTDVRLYQSDHVTPDAAAVERAAKLLAGDAETILSVGLTRAVPVEGAGSVHWLQVNNIHFRSDPSRTLAAAG